MAYGITDLANKELGLPTLGTLLVIRVAYMQALGIGLTVAELTDASAKAEAAFLVNNCLK